MKIYRLNALLILFFLVSCASTGVNVPPPEDREKVSDTVPEGDYVDTQINEEFDPLSLRDDQIDPAKLKSEKKSATEAQESIQVIPESEDVVFSEDVPRTATDSVGISVSQEMVPGWRVQICAIANEMKAREILMQAEDNFETYENLKVYFTYDSPYYKVRLGDCTSRYQADRLLQIAMENGFVDAWVVKTNVYEQEYLFRQSELPIESFQDSTQAPEF